MSWYKIAQIEKKPYKIYRIEGGRPDKVLDIPHIYAVSSEQARVMAFKKYPSLRNFVDGCIGRNQDCDIQARLDKEKWEEIQKYKEQQSVSQETVVQEAWWNK